MFGLFKKKTPTEPTADPIVPRIKHANFLNAIRGIAAKDPGSLPVTQPLVADLLITYAFDRPQFFQMFTERDRQSLGLSLDQLRAMAIANLRKQLPRATAEWSATDHHADRRQ